MQQECMIISRCRGTLLGTLPSVSFSIRFGGVWLLIRTGQTESCCEQTEGGPVRTIARLLEVMEDLKYRMNPIGTAKISDHQFICPHRGFSGFRVIVFCIGICINL